MSKAPAAQQPGNSASPPPSIPALRAQIDRIDRQLVELMNERARLAHAIGKIKDANGQCTYDPVREEEVLARAVELSSGPLANGALKNVFRELISGSRALERRVRVAYLGPEHTFSHLAAINRFGQSVELMPVASISAVFEEVHRQDADFGLVPLENSTDGRIVDTLDSFTRFPVKICGEVQLRIHHYLLGQCERGAVREVYSKPQPLSQCRNWLARHLPSARPVEVASTAAAAQLARENPHAAAIASRQAGVAYGLNVLAEKIEDNPGNITRFAVIGEQEPRKTGRDKTALMFEIEHRPGALADAMNIFKRARLNLTWIESFPISRPEGGYLFFAELEGHRQELRVRRACENLGKKSVRLVVLGSYARSEPAE